MMEFLQSIDHFLLITWVFMGDQFTYFSHIASFLSALYEGQFLQGVQDINNADKEE